MSNIPEPKKIWFNEPTNKKQFQPVLVYHSAEKMQNAIKSFPALLSHGNQSGQKRKNNSPPGPPRRKCGESKFAGAKATAHPAQANALDKLHQHQHHQHHQHHHHHQQFQKWKHAPKCRPQAQKNHHPCQKAKQTPIWDPKQTAFRVLGNVASFYGMSTATECTVKILCIICFQFYVMSLVMNQVNSSSKDYDTLSYPISQP